jgi:flagellar M-ring protein FliF
MAGPINSLLQQIKEIWHHFGANQKVSTISGLLLAVGLVVGLLLWSSRPSYRLLYAGMSLKDASTAQEKLEDEKVRVVLRDSGHALHVPAADVYRARLLLAAEGLPGSTTAGFELFEQPRFGLSDFAQQINYQRALQGELERTITALDGIAAARVMLVLPREKLFSRQNKKGATASIMLTVSRGGRLGVEQVRSVKHLVAGAVPGLTASSITITDQYGNLFDRASDEDQSTIQAAGDQLEAQSKIENMLAAKAQQMLDLALGVGGSVVKVSADLDFRKIENRNETYDQEGRVVISETISTEKSTGPSSASGGVAGLTANVPVSNPGSARIEQVGNEEKREDITTQYKVPSGVEVMVTAGARIRRLSISVCVASGDTPRDSEGLKSIERMVGRAVGIVQDSEREDTIEVVEMAFANTAQPTAVWWQTVLLEGRSIMPQALAGLVLLVLFIWSRRLMASLAIEKQDVGVPVGMMAGAPEGQALPSNMNHDGAPLNTLSRIAEQDPNAVAAWITTVARDNN